MKTATTSILATILLALALGGGQALAHSATAPPELIIEVIGGGSVTGTGLNCGLGQLTCSATYSDNSAQSLTATASTGWHFNAWQDGCTGTTSPCSATPANGGQTVTAVFARDPGLAISYQTFSVSLSSHFGEVVNGASSNTIACGDSDNDPSDADTDSDGTTLEATSCSVSVPQTSTITVQELPDDTYFFNGWGGSCSGTEPTCAVYLNTDGAVSADFLASATNSLSITVSGSGSVSGGGITCGAGATCTKEEPPTASVTLVATPASGYAFTGWDGACTGLQSTCTVQMNAARSVTANFDPLVSVLVTVNGAGTVTGANVTCGPGPATCNGSAAPSSTIQLQATPAVAGGSVFWTGCTSAASTICNINVNSTPISVTVTFSGGTGGGGGTTFVLSAIVSGDGYLTATQGATLWCTSAAGTGCAATVAQNTSVTLQAVPVSGDASDFNGWSGSGTGNCDDTSLTCTVVVTSASSVEADFFGSSTTYNLTASISGSGTVSGAGLRCTFTGSTGCTSPQATGASVTLTATPSPGSTFTGWSGGCTGTGQTCTVIMSAAKNVTATFATAPPGKEPLTIAVTGAGTVTYTGGSCKSTSAKGKTCETSARDNTTATLKATPAAGYGFSKWGGSCTSKTATCTVKMSGPQSVQATFVRLALAPGKKPKVTKLTTGFRVTLSFIAGEAGRLTVTTKPNVAHLTKTVKKGAGTARLTVKKHGLYVFTLSLHSKSGTHKLHYTVKV